MSNQALLCWSGGRDSTLMLYDTLALRNVKVRTISINHPQIENSKVQEHYRKILIEKLQSKFGEWEHKELHLDYGIRCSSGIQPCIWTYHALIEANDDEDIHVGYVHGDDYWSAQERYANLFTQLRDNIWKKGELITPYANIKKSTILTRLAELDLLRYTWYCQNGGLIPCGKCISCDVDMMAKYYLKMKEPNNYKSVMNNLKRKQ